MTLTRFPTRFVNRAAAISICLFVSAAHATAEEVDNAAAGTVGASGADEAVARTPLVEGFDEADPDTWGNPGRNEPCPCGSGKKFKHCHGRLS